MEPHSLGAHHDEEQPSNQETVGKLGYVQESLEQCHDPRQCLGGDYPDYDRESGYLTQQLHDAEDADGLGLTANGQTNDQESDHLGNNHCGEDSEADELLE